MASKTWYLVNATSDGWRRVSETAPGAGDIGDGWVVSTGATNHSEYFVGVERAASTFTGTTVPDGTLDTTNKDAFRTESAYTGDFAAANWEFHFVVRAGGNGGAQDGRIRFRLIKAAADGSGATEITAAQQSASIVTNVSTSADFDSTLTFNPGAISLNNEYLFIQIAWERTGAGGMSNSDINWRTGDSAPAGTRIVSSDFTASVQTLTPSLYTNTNTFYAPTVSSTYALTPALYTNTNTFYAPTVAASNTLVPALLTNGQTFYSPTVSGSGPQDLIPALFTNSQTFYSAVVSATNEILPPLYTNSNTFFSPTVSGGATESTKGDSNAYHAPKRKHKKSALQKRLERIFGPEAHENHRAIEKAALAVAQAEEIKTAALAAYRLEQALAYVEMARAQYLDTLGHSEKVLYHNLVTEIEEKIEKKKREDDEETILLFLMG